MSARPSLAQVAANIDHVEAAILGIEDANRVRLDRERAGKKTDGMAAFRQIRINGFREVLETLRWLHGQMEKRA